MFETLSDRLSEVFNSLTNRGSLKDSDVTVAMREVRRALIEADVALEVVREFILQVKEKAIGAEIIKSVTPGQMVVKIVHDELVRVLGSEAQPINLTASPPVPIMMIGLQGSGKTTSTSKISKRLTDRDKKKVLMVSLDTRRAAAQEQLKVLGEQCNIATLPIIDGQTPIQIAERAMQVAKLGSYDVVIYDTSGRTTVDERLMRETAEIKALVQPHETILVVDSLTGQDALKTAEAFERYVGITGTMLTRIDGDGRGGAALSMRAVTGKPIKLLGTGEKWDAIEDFHPERIAGRILGMGDVVSLVERAAETIDAKKAKKIADKIKRGAFDLNDLADQIKQMQRLGGMGGVLGMMPGIGKIKNKIADANLNDKLLMHQHAIITSMTKKERSNSKIINGKRRRRIAAGSGTKVQDVNQLLKMHRQMAEMMKKIGKNKGAMTQMLQSLGFGGEGGTGAISEMQMDIAAKKQITQKSIPEINSNDFPQLLSENNLKQKPPVSEPVRLPGLGGNPLPNHLFGLGKTRSILERKNKKR
ncbi:MAG: Signal recognition particle protein [Hyphomicrobiaceae bacterium hypho_1]